jgi:hypothetical protein
VFNSILEYPIVLVLACLLRPAPAVDPNREPARRRRDLALPLALGALTALLILGCRWYHVPPGQWSVALAFALPVVVGYTFVDRPVRFGLGIAAILLAGSLYQGELGKVEYQTRTFFGVHRVTLDPAGRFRSLVHGNTVHGRQSLDPARRGEPLTYYHRHGPVGVLFHELGKYDPRLDRVAIIGLGCGTLAAYARPGQHWTYFEIDPAVGRIAQDPSLFTYWHDAEERGVKLDAVYGDARLTLGQSKEHFGLIVVDAFSSDAIPVHLLTKEAVQMYVDHLRDGGLLLFHVSNNYLDFEPLLAALAADFRPPLVCRIKDDRGLSRKERQAGMSPSTWAVVALHEGDLPSFLVRKSLWEAPKPRPGLSAWTDDFSNLFQLLKPYESRAD